MENKKKIVLVGAAILLVLGLVMAVNAGLNATKAMEKHGMRGFSKEGCMRRGFPSQNVTVLDNLGLPENATREQVREAVWEKKLTELGLTENSTIREFRQALETRMQAVRDERIQKLEEKLNLPANATQEDIKNAMHQLRNDSKELLSGKGGRPVFGMRGGREWAGGCNSPARFGAQNTNSTVFQEPGA